MTGYALRWKDVVSVARNLHILSMPPDYPGTPDTMLGHEFVGYVVDAGDGVTDTKIGNRVSVAANLTCGKC